MTKSATDYIHTIGGAFESYSCGTGDVRGATPLWIAAYASSGRGNNTEILRTLLEAGADVNRPLPNGQSLLQMAIRNQHYSLAQALLASSADPRATDKGGRTALHDLIAAREPPRRRRAPEEIAKVVSLCKLDLVPIDCAVGQFADDDDFAPLTGIRT